jgi:hypothetical protein
VKHQANKTILSGVALGFVIISFLSVVLKFYYIAIVASILADVLLFLMLIEMHEDYEELKYKTRYLK